MTKMESLQKVLRMASSYDRNRHLKISIKTEPYNLYIKNDATDEFQVTPAVTLLIVQTMN